LTAWNARYPDTLNVDAATLHPGLPLFDLVLSVASRGDFGDDAPREMAQARVRQLSKRSFRGDVSFGDDRIFDAQSSRTTDGAMIITYTDITERKKAERILSDAMKLINESIQYASRIQRALLPHEAALDAAFTEHFVIWEPKDVVGGDMVWHRPLKKGCLMVVADCTGHGPPGAFMTMIATGALDQALRDVVDGDPAEIITHMNRVIKTALGQDRADGESDDGVELGVCRIIGKEFTFAGARFSLYRVADEDIEEIKGDKSGIGYRRVSMDQAFTNHAVEIHDDDAFYIWTDGITDQIGGVKRRSFGNRRVKKYILDFHRMSMTQQRVHLMREYVEYQHHEERRDDITFIGFRLRRA